MRYFYTLFDSAYLSRGLAMYESLVAHCSDFTLWILAFDQRSREYLAVARLPNVRLVDLNNFEDEELRAAKGNRSRVECSLYRLDNCLSVNFASRCLCWQDPQNRTVNRPEYPYRSSYSPWRSGLVDAPQTGQAELEDCETFIGTSQSTALRSMSPRPL